MKLRERQNKLWEERDTASYYWTAEKHRERIAWFVRNLRGMRFGSIYEVGCNSGRNLWEIRQEYPDRLIGGLDINKEAIRFAKNKMPYGDFSVQNIHEMSVERKYDIVFTSGVLLHVPPVDVKNILSRCIKKSKKYVLHMETNGERQIINGPKSAKPTKKISNKLRCIHNYAKIYEELGYSAKVRNIPKGGEDDAAHIIIVKLAEVPWKYR